MKGTIEFFQTGRGFGSILGEDGKKYFAHWKQISNVGTPGLKMLITGEQVLFNPAKGQKGMEAHYIIQCNTGMIKRTDRPVVDLGRDANLRIDSIGRVYVKGETNEIAISPSEEAPGVRAYRVTKEIMEFTFTMPESTADTGFVLLDPEKVVRTARSNTYEGVARGSHFLKLSRNGALVITRPGCRRQDQGSWLTIDTRLKLQLDLSKPIQNQLPVDGWQKDNDGFTAGIEKAMRNMDMTPAPSAAWSKELLATVADIVLVDAGKGNTYFQF